MSFSFRLWQVMLHSEFAIDAVIFSCTMIFSKRPCHSLTALSRLGASGLRYLGYHARISLLTLFNMVESIPVQDEAFGIVPIFQADHAYQFLVIQHLAGHWGFPKGHADPGEDAIQAACREFVEETGISGYTLLATVKFSEQYNYIRDGQSFHKTVVYYPAMVESQTVACQPDEIRDYAWLTYEAAIARLSFEGAKRVLAEVKQYLET